MPKNKKPRRHQSTSSSSSSSTDSSSPKRRRTRRESKNRKRKHRKEIEKSEGIQPVSHNNPYQPYNVQPVSNTIIMSSIIPEFDPNLMEITDWIEIIDYNSIMHKWADNFIVYQALSKLKGTAKTWYDSYIETEMGWSKFSWEQWKQILKTTFKSTRNAYQLLQNITNHKPTEGCSLYDFHFNHLAKINKLKLNFSETDKVSLIIGAIGDNNISAAVEASNIKDTSTLGAYLKNKIYITKTKATHSSDEHNYV